MAYLIFRKNIEGITKINSVVVPILILLIFTLGIKNIFRIDINQIGQNLVNIGQSAPNFKNNFFWWIQSIVYASYNLILLIPVMINLKKFIKGKKQIKVISIITTLILCIMTTLSFLLLINVDTDFSNLEMPIIYVIKNNFIEFKTIYGIVILLAIFTTAISVGISFLNNICKDKKNIPCLSIILCISSIFVSKIGFSNLVKALFPLFGYLGLLQIYFILKVK